MLKEDCFLLGKVSKSIGLKGTVSILLNQVKPERLKTLESILINVNGVLIPFFLEHYKFQKGKFLVVELEGVNSEKDTQQLIGNEVFVDSSLLKKLADKQYDDFEVIDFLVYDQNENEIGTIANVINAAGNIVFEMNEPEGLMLPAHQDLILKLDRNNKSIQLQIPDGLLEIYE